MSSLKRYLFPLCAAAALALAIAGGSSAASEVKKIGASMELVGQVIGSPPAVSPATSAQFGYVAYLHGLPIFNPGAENESTARLTFYTDTTTLRVTNNGPLRIISREGTITIYNDPAANGSFASPDSFRDGTPVLVASLRQQVIINTLTGAFTTLNENRITSTAAFQAGTDTVQIANVGQQFRTLLSGQLNATPPPTAHIAGYTVPVNDSPKKKRPYSSATSTR